MENSSRSVIPREFASLTRFSRLGFRSDLAIKWVRETIDETGQGIATEQWPPTPAGVASLTVALLIAAGYCFWAPCLCKSTLLPYGRW